MIIFYFFESFEMVVVIGEDNGVFVLIYFIVDNIFRKIFDVFLY